MPLDFSESTGEKNGKKWTKYGIQGPDKRWFGTFDDKIAALAKQSMEDKTELKVMFLTDGKWNNIVSAEVL